MRTPLLVLTILAGLAAAACSVLDTGGKHTIQTVGPDASSDPCGGTDGGLLPDGGGGGCVPSNDGGLLPDGGYGGTDGGGYGGSDGGGYGGTDGGGYGGYDAGGYGGADGGQAPSDAY